MTELTEEQLETIGNNVADMLINLRNNIVAENNYPPHTNEETEAFRTGAIMGTAIIITNLIQRDEPEFIFGKILHTMIEVYRESRQE